jgi:glutamine cyclotransferase
MLKLHGISSFARTLLAAAFLAFSLSPAFAANPQYYDYEIVNSYPHDPEAFTQGLFLKDGFLYESTGIWGRSSIRKVELKSGKVLQKRDLPAEIFGEGVAPWAGDIVGLTWRDGYGYVADGKDFKEERRFTYAGEGWGLTSDGKRLIMSDGTATLRFIDPTSLAETHRVTVTVRGKPLALLNELEWVDGEVFANVWGSGFIVRIDPESGIVAGVIDLRSLRKQLGAAPAAEVLNGVAYDEKGKRLFVTGKLWPKLFEIKLKPRAEKTN